MMKKWFIEGTEKNSKDYYICWHQFFDTRAEALKEIDRLGWKKDNLKNYDGTKARFRVRRYNIDVRV